MFVADGRVNETRVVKFKFLRNFFVWHYLINPIDMGKNIVKDIIYLPTSKMIDLVHIKK